jgi:hypothetical protein
MTNFGTLYVEFPHEKDQERLLVYKFRFKMEKQTCFFTPPPKKKN